MHWDNPEGWDGGEVGGVRGAGTHVHSWLIHVDVWQKPPQYCNWPSIKVNLKNRKLSAEEMMLSNCGAGKDS